MTHHAVAGPPHLPFFWSWPGPLPCLAPGAAPCHPPGSTHAVCQLSSTPASRGTAQMAARTRAPQLAHPRSSWCFPCRPLVEERIRERRQMRATNSLPVIDDLHRKPQHRRAPAVNLPARCPPSASTGCRRRLGTAPLHFEVQRMRQQPLPALLCCSPPACRAEPCLLLPLQGGPHHPCRLAAACHLAEAPRCLQLAGCCLRPRLHAWHATHPSTPCAAPPTITKQTHPHNAPRPHAPLLQIQTSHCLLPPMHPLYARVAPVQLSCHS